MKKVLSLIIAICLTLTVVTIPVIARFNDVASYAHYRSAVERLANLGIIGGVGDNNFNPGGNLTRAQFARIATIVAGHESEVIGNASTRRFSDVDVSHWANGYINTVASHGIITGFPAGDYQPEQPINFAEAVTIVLRLLGWDHEDLGHNWPFAYINKARELGLTAGVEQDAFDWMTRANIAVIIDRALNTEMNTRVFPGQQLLITRMDFTQTAETIVFATRAEDPSLASDEIRTTLGAFRTVGNLEIPLMARVRLILNSTNQVVDVAVTSQPRSRNVVIDAVFTGGIAYTTLEGGRGSINLDDNSIIYHRGNRFTFSQLPAIQPGSEMIISYTDAGTVDSILIRELSLQGPIVVREEITSNSITQIGSLSFQPGARVIRDGFAAQLTDIRRYDVVYYAASTNTLHVYIDKVSGVYERAYPTKAAVTGIVLSGVHLQIETAAAAHRLGENPGSFPIGARFTALLGRDGGIVYVVNMTTGDLGGIAFILSTQTRISQEIDTLGRQEWFTTVMTGNGTTMEFRSDRDYAEQRGRVMRLSFDGELATFNSLNPTRITGAVNQANRTIGGRRVPQSARIIEVVSTRHADGTARVIDFTDISQNQLTESHILHTETDQFGDITAMFVQNITMSQYTFGYMTNVNINSVGMISARYTIIIDGVSREFTTQGSAFTNVNVGPVGVVLGAGNNVERLRSLNRTTTRGRVEAIDFSQIRVGGDNFTLARDVQIYRVNRDRTVDRVALADLDINAMNDIRLYSDAGLVRVVTFRL